MLAFAVLIAWWVYSNPTSTAFSVVSAIVLPFLYGGVYGSVEEALSLGGGKRVGVGSFLRNGIGNYPVLFVGISLKYASFWVLLTVGRFTIMNIGENSEFLIAQFGGLALLLTPTVASVTVVSGVLVLFVFQFFGVAAVGGDKEGTIESILWGFRDSYGFVNEHTGSVAEYMAVSLPLFLIPSAAVVSVIREESIPTLPLLAYMTVAWGAYYTYRVVYYRSVLSDS